MQKEIKHFQKSSEKTLQKGQDDFEKQLSFISAGTLGISMVLVDKIIKNISGATNKWMLIGSWSFLGATLVVNLLSHYFSIHFNYRNLDEINCDTYDERKSIKRNNIIRVINIFTLCTLTVGIFFLILFMSLNI